MSIVIVSYNTCDLLRQCLRSISDAELGFSVEIIVVDNGSRDQSPQMVRAEFSHVRLICNRDNRMYAVANNQGIAAARGDYLLLLNSDTIVHPKSLDALVAFLSTRPEVAAAGPLVLNFDGSTQSCGFLAPSVLAAALGAFSIGRLPLPRWVRRRLCLEIVPDAPPRRVGWISGCCMLIRRSALATVGGLCEELFFYGEEVEWCCRAVKQGYEIWCVPSAAITHLGGGSTKGEIVQRITEDHVRLKNFATHQLQTVGRRKAIAMAVVVIAGNLFRYAALRLVRPRSAPVFLRHVKWEIRVLRYLSNKECRMLEPRRRQNARHVGPVGPTPTAVASSAGPIAADLCDATPSFGGR